MLLFTLPLLIGCKQSGDAAQTLKPHTEVTLTHVENGNIGQQIELQAVTEYLHTIQITAPVNGYIRSLPIHPGQRVARGVFLFSMVSAEQQALGLPVVPQMVRASHASIVISVSPQTGSYVTEGSIVCSLTDLNSLVFCVKVPVEYTHCIHQGTHCTLILPDGRQLHTSLSSPLMNMDSSDQTIDYVVHAPSLALPAGLQVGAHFILSSGRQSAHQILPIAAVQSDDNMTHFWVMRMVTDSTVERVNVTVGNHNKDQVEILSPHLAHSNHFVLNGAYGLADGALVTVK